MDRQIVQVGAIPLDSDLLNTNRFAMTGLGMALLALLGSGTYADGLACAPVAGTMQIQIGPGAIYTLAGIDNTAYGSLPADAADQIVQQGLTFGQTVLTLTAPSAAGYSQIHLVEAQFQQTDTNAVALQYYNASNPTQPFPGAPTSTIRRGVCALQVKAGTAAAAPAAPAADAGWVPLYTVTVAAGQTAVTAGNIATASGAPFIRMKIGSPNADNSLRLTTGGLQVNEPVTYISGAQPVLTTVNHLANLVAAAAASIPLPQTASIWNGWGFSVNAQGGAVTLSPNAADSIAGAAQGLAYTFPAGTSGFVVGDGAGKFSIFYFSAPASGLYVNASLVMVPGTTYQIDSRGGPFTLTLPANPAQGMAMRIIDVGQSLAGAGVTLARNGGTGTIMGVAQDCTLNVSGIELTVWNNGYDWRFQ